MYGAFTRLLLLVIMMTVDKAMVWRQVAPRDHSLSVNQSSSQTNSHHQPRETSPAPASFLYPTSAGRVIDIFFVIFHIIQPSAYNFYRASA